MIDPALKQQFANLSTGELAAVASSPMSAVEQMAALAELGQRMKAEQAQPPKSTVLQDMTQNRMSVRPSSGAPVNPIASGINAIMQQQGQPPQQQPPLQMASGGRIMNSRIMPNGPFFAVPSDPDDPYVPQPRGEESPPRPRSRRRGGAGGNYINDMQRMIPALRSYYDEAADMYPENPEEAMAAAGQFMGPDRFAPFLAELESQRGDSAKTRNRDRWLAVANAGFRMMGAPTFWSGAGRGGIAAAEGLSEAEKKYADANRENFRGRLGIASAQSDRDSRQGSSASNLYAQGLGARSNAVENSVRAALSIAEQQGADRRSNASIAADRNRLVDQFNQLLDMGYSEDQAREIIGQAIAGRSGTPPNNIDSYVSYAKELATNMSARNDFIARYGQGAYDDLMARAGLVAGGGGAPSTEQPTTEQPTTESPSGAGIGAGIGAAGGSAFRVSQANAPPSARPTQRTVLRNERTSPSGPPAVNVDGVRINYGDRPPGGSRRQEKDGYTYEPG